MTGAARLTGRYWPTPKAYAALADLYVTSGMPIGVCPCAVADNEATGQGEEPEWSGVTS